MNPGESTSGCSSSGRENGAASLDPERSHKKARFSWQIKGKHHLKNPASEPTVSSNVSPEESDTPPGSERIPPFQRRLIQEMIRPSRSNLLMPTHVNYLPGGPTDIPNNHNPPLPIQTVISLAESMLQNSEIEVTKTGSTSTQDLPGPSKLFFNTAKEARRLKRKEENCIAQWQTHQTITGCFDNTINCFIESQINSSAEAHQRFLAMEMANIMRYADDLNSNDENVENEGILMAINAHGLQSMGHPTIEPTSPLPAVQGVLASDSESNSSYSSIDRKLFTNSDSLPWFLNERSNNSEEPANYEPWRPVHEIVNTNPTDQFPTAGEDYEYEFMNTAVIQAIKSKGLMAAGTDFV